MPLKTFYKWLEGVYKFPGDALNHSTVTSKRQYLVIQSSVTKLFRWIHAKALESMSMGVRKELGNLPRAKYSSPKDKWKWRGKGKGIRHGKEILIYFLKEMNHLASKGESWINRPKLPNIKN